jgi:hypothetical protein
MKAKSSTKSSTKSSNNNKIRQIINNIYSIYIYNNISLYTEDNNTLEPRLDRGIEGDK